MEKDVNFTIILSFLYFKKKFIVFKNTLKTPKMNFAIVVFGTPQCFHHVNIGFFSFITLIMNVIRLQI
jgi:hypothetical protein